MFHLKDKGSYLTKFWIVSWSRFTSKKHVDFYNPAYSISYKEHTVDIKKPKTIIQGDNLSLQVCPLLCRAIISKA